MNRPRDGVNRGPVRIAEALDRLRRDLGVPVPSAAAALEGAVRTVLGPLVEHLTGLRLRRDVLVVEAQDPAIAEAVRLRSQAIIDALAAADPPVRCSRVDVRVDRRGGAGSRDDGSTRGG